MVGGQLAHLEAAEGGGLVGGARHLLDARLAQALVAVARHALDHPREGGSLAALVEAGRRSLGALAEEVLVDVRLLLAVLLRELLERHVERGAPGVLHAARDRDVRRLVEELLEHCVDVAGAQPAAGAVARDGLRVLRVLQLVARVLARREACEEFRQPWHACQCGTERRVPRALDDHRKFLKAALRRGLLRHGGGVQRARAGRGRRCGRRRGRRWRGCTMRRNDPLYLGFLELHYTAPCGKRPRM